MKSITYKITSCTLRPWLGALLLLCTMPSQAWAQAGFEALADEDGELKGYGGEYVVGVSAVYSHHTNFDDDLEEDEPPLNTYGILIEGAAMPFRTLFGAHGGVEMSLGLGFRALRTYFGGFQGKLGVMITPVPLGPLHLSMAAGAAFGGHRRVYLKPRALLDFKVFALEASYMWNPPKASRVWDEGGPPGSYGVEEKRLRGQFWLQLEEPDGSGDIRVHGFHLFVEQTTIDSPTPEILEQKRIVPGTYWSGGLGASF